MKTGLSELDDKRLFKALDIALQSKGLVFSEEPDFLIHIEGSSIRSAPTTSVGIGAGGTGRNVGGGISVGLPVGGANFNRILQFDFVDSTSLKEDLPPMAREKKLEELVLKTLNKYPPKSRKKNQTSD